MRISEEVKEDDVPALAQVEHHAVLVTVPPPGVNEGGAAGIGNYRAFFVCTCGETGPARNRSYVSASDASEHTGESQFRNVSVPPAALELMEQEEAL